MSKFNLVCEQCGSRYEISPDGWLDIPKPLRGQIACQTCQGVLYEYEQSDTTYGAQIMPPTPPAIFTP
jgi:hypothetical protein